MADPGVAVTAAGRDLVITHPEKVFFEERGDTKLDLVRYYQSVEAPLMAAMGGRPVLLQRFPNGASGSSFFQKRVPESRPDWLETAEVSTPNGTTSQALVAADLAHVLQETAHEVRVLFDSVGVAAHPKTTGNRGIHIYVRLLPLWSSYDVRAAAVAVARELERRRPDLVTAAWWKEERGTRVFVDFNQNAPHKTIFGAWSVRARPGAQVSTPFDWAELDSIVPDELTIATVPIRVAQDGDPWRAATTDPQSLEPLLALHARDRADGLLDAPWPPVYPKMPGEPPRVAPSRAKKTQ